MYTLGINAAFHDPAATLVKDGIILAAAEEERFTHIKHSKRPIPFSTCELPHNTIDFCLKTAGINLTDVDHIAYSFGPKWVASTGLFQPYPIVSHEVHRHIGLMAFLGIQPQGDALEFNPGDAAKKQVCTLLVEPQATPGRYVCLHPGGISGRRWPANRFAEVGDARTEKGYTIILTGTAAERSIHDDVRQQMTHPALSLAGQTNLSTLGAVLQLAALLVSNDTGVAHLAMACHTPSVILFTSASPAEWGPLDTVRHRIIREEDAHGANQVIAEAVDLLQLSA